MKYEMKNFNNENYDNIESNNMNQNDQLNLNENNENENENESSKTILNCTYCNKHVNPIIEKYTPFYVYIFIIICFLILSFFTIFLIPLILLTFKQKKYICPFCKKSISFNSHIFEIKRQNNILTFQFQNFAIVISIKYLILFLSLVSLIFIFYIIRKTNNINFESLSKGPLINITWNEYLDDCGSKSQFRNRFHSVKSFNTKYYAKTVIWNGYFHHIKEGFFHNSLFLKMNPSEYKYDKPDIECIFNNSLIAKIENLEKDDLLEFECTLFEISKNKNPHMCLLWNIKLIEKGQKKKTFTVIEFLKPVSIFDIIGIHPPNPYFINEPNLIPPKIIEIKNINDLNDGNDEHEFTMDMLNGDISGSSDDVFIKHDNIHFNNDFNDHEPMLEEEYITSYFDLDDKDDIYHKEDGEFLYENSEEINDKNHEININNNLDEKHEINIKNNLNENHEINIENNVDENHAIDIEKNLDENVEKAINYDKTINKKTTNI